MVDDTEVITIPLKHYEDLLEDQEWLNCLENAGVDNWSGYEYAQELLREDKETDN